MFEGGADRGALADPSQIKKSDAAKYVNAGADKARWVPAGAPKLVFKELNQAVGVQSVPVKIVPGPFILRRDGSYNMVARQTITITGDFCQSTPALPPVCDATPVPPRR